MRLQITLRSLLGVGPNVGPVQAQKRLPPRRRRRGRPFRRPESDDVVVVHGEELFSEGGDPLRRRRIVSTTTASIIIIGVLEGQEPSLEEELVGAAHHGVVGDGEFEVRGDLSRLI